MLTTITRRIRGLAVIGAALACLNPAWAADYPERPVTAMVPFPAGGSNGPGGASLSEPAGCAAGRRGARVEVVAPSKPSGIGESPKSACGVW